MKVQLIAMTQPIGEISQNVPYNPCMVAERCASVCYNSQPTKIYRIMESCIKSGHISILEHISFTFYIEEVSRALLAQLSRHRHISLSVESQRYVNMENFKFVVPAFKDGECGIIFDDAMVAALNKYQQLVKDGEKLEDARMVLPNACTTKLYMTANARSLIEISHLRLCNRAQWEIRQLFAEIKNEVDKYCPEIAKYMVPSCKSHVPAYCPEVKGCGLYPKLSDIITSLEEQNKLYELDLMQARETIDYLEEQIDREADEIAYREDESSY